MEPPRFSRYSKAMVGFRSSRWLDACAQAAVRLIEKCQTLHLAQLAFAFARFSTTGAALTSTRGLQGLYQLLLKSI